MRLSQEKRNGKSGCSAKNMEKNIFNRLITALMEPKDESTISPVRKNEGKNNGNGYIDDGCSTATSCDESTTRTRNATTLQQSLHIILEMEKSVRAHVMVR